MTKLCPAPGRTRVVEVPPAAKEAFAGGEVPKRSWGWFRAPPTRRGAGSPLVAKEGAEPRARGAPHQAASDNPARLRMGAQSRLRMRTLT